MSVIAIRAIRPDDKARIVRAFQGLDRRSVYLRFFSYKKELSEEELRGVSECDGVREVVLVATVGSGDQEIIVGVSGYLCTGVGAEIAFTVAEDFQGRGIATRLLRQLAEIARDRGILQLEADALTENTPILNVLRHSGLRMRASQGAGIVHATIFPA